eukprot:Filipodium_phascolosomae@DN318_c0_g1_i1.p1
MNRMNFALRLEKVHEWRRQNKEIFLICMKLKKQSIAHYWPRSITVRVNDYAVVRVDPPTPERKRKDEIVNVTKFFRQGENQIVIEFLEKEESYVLCWLLTGTTSVEEIENTVRSTRSLNESECHMRAQRVLQNQKLDSDEICIMQTNKLPLVCPIALSRMSIPARGRECAHIQCFDLVNYLQVNQRLKAMNNRWKCGVCSQYVRPQDLEVDGWVQGILNTTQEKAREVEIAEDGGWKVTDCDDSDESEQTGGDVQGETQHLDDSMKEEVTTPIDQPQEPDILVDADQSRKRKRDEPIIIDIEDDDSPAILFQDSSAPPPPLPPHPPPECNQIPQTDRQQAPPSMNPSSATTALNRLRDYAPLPAGQPPPPPTSPPPPPSTYPSATNSRDKYNSSYISSQPYSSYLYPQRNPPEPIEPPPSPPTAASVSRAGTASRPAPMNSVAGLPSQAFPAVSPGRNDGTTSTFPPTPRIAQEDDSPPVNSDYYSASSHHPSQSYYDALPYHPDRRGSSRSSESWGRTNESWGRSGESWGRNDGRVKRFRTDEDPPSGTMNGSAVESSTRVYRTSNGHGMPPLPPKRPTMHPGPDPNRRRSINGSSDRRSVTPSSDEGARTPDSPNHASWLGEYRPQRSVVAGSVSNYHRRHRALMGEDGRPQRSMGTGHYPSYNRRQRGYNGSNWNHNAFPS